MGLTSVEVSRADFLKLSAAGLAFGTFAAVTGCSGGSGKYKVLSDAQAGTITAFSQRMVPDIEGSPVSVRDMDIGGALDFLLTTQTEKNVGNVKLALNMLEIGPILFSLKFSRFTKLSPEEQDEFVHSLLNSSSNLKRSIVFGIKSFAIFAMYEDPRMTQMYGIEELEYCR